MSFHGRIHGGALGITRQYGGYSTLFLRVTLSKFNEDRNVSKENSAYKQKVWILYLGQSLILLDSKSNTCYNERLF